MIAVKPNLFYSIQALGETVIFHKLVMGKPEGESVKYDLCGKCAPMVKVYCFGAEAKVESVSAGRDIMINEEDANEKESTNAK